MEPDAQRRLDDLAEVVTGNARAHNSLAAAHDKLADDMRRKDQEAAQEKRLDNLSKMVAVTYDKAAAYTNVILIAGYASFFAIWSSTKPVLSSRISMGAVLLVLVSAAAFIGFETYKMIGNAMFLRRSQAFLSDPTGLQSPEIFQQRLDEYNARNHRHGMSFVHVWIGVLAVAVPTALFAVGLLAYNYLLILLHLDPAQTRAGILASVLGLVLSLLGALAVGLIPYFGRVVGSGGLIVFKRRLWAWSWAAAWFAFIAGAGLSFLAPH